MGENLGLSCLYWRTYPYLFNRLAHLSSSYGYNKKLYQGYYGVSGSSAYQPPWYTVSRYSQAWNKLSSDQAPIDQRVYNAAIHWISPYPVDNAIRFPEKNIVPLIKVFKTHAQPRAAITWHWQFLRPFPLNFLGRSPARERKPNSRTIASFHGLYSYRTWLSTN